MDDYDLAIKSRLKFKGEKKAKKRKRPKEDETTSKYQNQERDARAEDADDHGGWWAVKAFEHARGDITIEFLPSCYAKALSNGRIVLGQPHPPGDGPDEEEIFTAISAGPNLVAIKSGYGRYLTVNNKNRLMGTSEAVGEREKFVPVFEDDKMALCAHNNCFISPEDSGDDRRLIAQSETVGPDEICTIRLSHDPLRSKQRLLT